MLIGKDTRISGYMLESALEAGFAAAGVDVLLTGPLPTPGVAYLTRALRLDLGVVISASHNPFDDNGIKFFSARGEKLPDAWEREIEARARRSRRAAVGSARARQGAPRSTMPRGRYIEFCKSTFPQRARPARHEASSSTARTAPPTTSRPHVFHELGAEVDRDRLPSPTASTSTPASARPRPQALVAAVGAHRRRLRHRARRRRRPPA